MNSADQLTRNCLCALVFWTFITIDFKVRYFCSVCAFRPVGCYEANGCFFFSYRCPLVQNERKTLNIGKSSVKKMKYPENSTKCNKTLKIHNITRIWVYPWMLRKINYVYTWKVEYDKWWDGMLFESFSIKSITISKIELLVFLVLLQIFPYTEF